MNLNRGEEQPLRAVLVGLQLQQSDEEFDIAMKELGELASACGIEPVTISAQKASVPVQATYIGSGKVGEIKNLLEMLDVDLVIFDQTLTPMQFRNLGRVLGAEVMDRTGLILRIFAEQARTREARLQVEHARLQYIMPRLAGMWTHFGRQAGSSGSRSNRGIGETQLELDRRHTQQRMAELEKELKAIDRERETQRERRLKSGLPRVSLVGYTNAGKSTLMNRLLECNEMQDKDKKVLEQDKLFATLDTTVRKIAPKGHRPILLSDTVGFINELPHALVKAFRSTLEEVRYADLLLQVVDYSSPNYRECMQVTVQTLREIGAAGIPMLIVYNKVDQVDGLAFSVPAVRRDSIYMAAGKGIGVEELLSLIERKLCENMEVCTFLIPYPEGGILHRLQETEEIISVEYRSDGTLVTARCRKETASRYSSYRYDGSDGS